MVVGPTKLVWLGSTTFRMIPDRAAELRLSTRWVEVSPSRSRRVFSMSQIVFIQSAFSLMLKLTNPLPEAIIFAFLSGITMNTPVVIAASWE